MADRAGAAGAGALRDHRRRRRRGGDRLPPDPPGLDRCRPARSVRADFRLDLPLGRAGGAAPLEPDPDPDDGRQRRHLPRAGRPRPASIPAGARSARCAWPPRRSGWRSCAARPAGPRPMGCRWSWSAPQEAQARFPLMVTDGVQGAAWLPTDGYLDPSGLTQALAAGARSRGATILPRTRVTGIGVERGRVTGRDHRARRDRGRGGGQRGRHVRAARSVAWRGSPSRSSRSRTSTWSPSRSRA